VELEASVPPARAPTRLLYTVLANTVVNVFQKALLRLWRHKQINLILSAGISAPIAYL